jgi:ABC-type multidrug transport system ATPase subunit
LDNKTSFEIEKAILSIKDLTAIVITHKLTPEILESYDKIYVLKNGRLIEEGSFNTLVCYNLTNEKKEKLIKVLESKVFDLNQLAFSRQAIEFLIEDPDRKVLMPSCSNSSSSVTVDADGTVYPCFHRKKYLPQLTKTLILLKKAIQNGLKATMVNWIV